MKPVPKSIERAVHRRLTQTSKSRKYSRKAIDSGRPLDAEDDGERKLAFIQRCVSVDRRTASRIASYHDPDELPLTPAQRARAESLQGDSVDFVPIRFFDTGRAASHSVARVAFPDRSPQGTGFMVGPRLLLTNHHVISSMHEAREYVLEFNFEDDVNGERLPVTRFRLDPDTLFLSDPEDDLDFAVVAVGGRIDGAQDLDDFGFLPLLDIEDKHIKGMFVNVIQHPAGRPKELVVRENRIVARTANAVLYGADTLRGSSGSPVFNDDWEVIALHHYGTPYRALRDSDAPPKLADEANEGIRISSIVQHLRAELPQLATAAASLVSAAINPPFRHPSLYRPEGLERSVRSMAKSVERSGNREAGLVLGSDGSATMTVPLVVSVRIGGQMTGANVGTYTDTPPEAGIGSTESPEAFKFVPDPKYSNRRGYNRSFLGVKVDLPKLTEAQQNIAAKNLKAKAEDDPFEVKYQHFSVVTNGERRLPFFTAANIDGGSVVTIVRKTGVVSSVEKAGDESAEAYETWYDDERIAANQRSDQSLYDAPALKGFQRGHMVKRTDPSWGTVQKAFRGQADTFHFTNCAPQHEKFNPIRTRWAGVEDWITDGSDDEDMRVTVFTGPVLDDDDPARSYIKVPLSFWKIVVRVENGELLATGILADQSKFVLGEAAGPEDLPPFPDKLPDEYQCTISEIEELTKLDFGPLRDHDTFEPGNEAAASRRRIRNFEDIQIRRRR